jgi:hypothetical protein
VFNTRARSAIGGDIAVAAEIADLAEGEPRAISIQLGDRAVYFAYVEVHQTDADRMAWSAPIWIVKR